MNDIESTYYFANSIIEGTASSSLAATLGGDSYIFASPNFKVQYSGNAITNLGSLFNDQSGLASIDKWKVDTSKVTDIGWMLQGD